MIVKNNKPVGRWFFYKVNGVALKEYIAGYSEMNIIGLTNESQIIYNGHDQALRNVEDKFGKSFTNSWAVPSDPASEFTNYSVSAVTWGSAFSITGGTLAPSGSTIQIPEGENQLFTMTTVSGYYISAATLDEVSILNNVSDSAQTATYTLENIAQDHALRFQLGYEMFNFTGVTDSSTGGTIWPSGATNSVGRGDDELLRMVSEDNYYLSGITINGGANQISAITGSISGTSWYTETNVLTDFIINIGYAAYGD